MKPTGIKVTIADRPYRLKALPHEADRVRRAAQLIQDKVRLIHTEYGVLDKQDALAMTALLIATELLEIQDQITTTPNNNETTTNENTQHDNDSAMHEQLQQLDNILTEFLQKN